ncbi:hypothetical protein JTB14_031961 [Gonioctena quinquepunctata]|nr:hypothetical protein JTB14_031961 [Gonioctena quinquepunctata]
MSEDEIYEALRSIKSNAYGVDFISIKMLLYCMPLLNPFFTQIINTSLEKGIFPDIWKEAPVIQFNGVPSPSCSNEIDPISNLSVMSKMMERLMHRQLVDYLNFNEIFPPNQSGFRVGHLSTSAVTEITDEKIASHDVGKVIALVMLDYSKAFDKISHKLMLSKMKYYGTD